MHASIYTQAALHEHCTCNLKAAHTNLQWVNAKIDYRNLQEPNHHNKIKLRAYTTKRNNINMGEL